MKGACVVSRDRWYVIQVESGRESHACRLIKSSVDDALSTMPERDAEDVLLECFIPLYKAEQKFSGEWRMVEKKLFPGYVVAISKDVGTLNEILRSVPSFTRILGNGNAFVPLDRAEMEFIDSFTNKDNRVIETSRAIAEGDAITVVEGPLIGHESWIKKINRRKGTALIEVYLFGRTLTTEIGLATVSKRPDEGKAKDN